MAAQIPSFLIADGKDNLGGLLAYEGIIDVSIRRTDNEYPIDGDGVGMRQIVREIIFTYRPPVVVVAMVPVQNFVPVNWYDWLDKDVTVQFTWTAVTSLITRTYPHMIVREVNLRKYYDAELSAYVDAMDVIMRMPQPELNAARQTRE